MRLDQILIRPERNDWIVRYSDEAGRMNSITISATNNATITALVADATSRLPAAVNNPAKAEIEQEIASLEDRVRLLKQSIGAT